MQKRRLHKNKNWKNSYSIEAGTFTLTQFM